MADSPRFQGLHENHSRQSAVPQHFNRFKRFSMINSETRLDGGAAHGTRDERGAAPRTGAEMAAGEHDNLLALRAAHNTRCRQLRLLLHDLHNNASRRGQEFESSRHLGTSDCAPHASHTENPRHRGFRATGGAAWPGCHADYATHFAGYHAPQTAWHPSRRVLRSYGV